MPRVSPRYDRIECTEDAVRCWHANSIVWELPISAIRIIAESTDDNGPFTDDYFFCFVLGKREWYECSFYSEGREEFLQKIEERLEIDIDLGLAGSADFASRILWPPMLLDQPLFTYTRVRSRSFLRRLFGIAGVHREFTPEVIEFLDQTTANPPREPG